MQESVNMEKQVEGQSREKSRFDVIVVGAGPGGSTLAALVAKMGRRVLLIDKNPSVGQSGSKQPKGDSPVKGLFYVGNDAGGSGLGTNQAVDSGINVSRMVLEYIKENNL
jgi:NADPH-dependent 2,4-dienoyl-CoA reductase/sulfur reductase-like enzyme